MAHDKFSGLGVELARSAGPLIVRRSNVRHDFEALGLLLAILVVLFILTVTIGVAPPV